MWSRNWWPVHDAAENVACLAQYLVDVASAECAEIKSPQANVGPVLIAQKYAQEAQNHAVEGVEAKKRVETAAAVEGFVAPDLQAECVRDDSEA